MKHNGLLKVSKECFFVLIILFTGAQAFSQRYMEYLDRGVIAVRTTGDSVFIGWRMLGNESDDICL